jgi:hypothetical protein
MSMISEPYGKSAVAGLVDGVLADAEAAGRNPPARTARARAMRAATRVRTNGSRGCWVKVTPNTDTHLGAETVPAPNL